MFGGVHGRTSIVSGRSTVAMVVRPGQVCCSLPEEGWRTGVFGGVLGRTSIGSGRSTVAMVVRPVQLLRIVAVLVWVLAWYSGRCVPIRPAPRISDGAGSRGPPCVAAAASRCSRQVNDLGAAAGAPGGMVPPLGGRERLARTRRPGARGHVGHGQRGARRGCCGISCWRGSWLAVFGGIVSGAYLIVNAAVATAPAPTPQRLPTAAENRMPFRGCLPRAPRFARERVAVQGGSKQERK